MNFDNSEGVKKRERTWEKIVGKKMIQVVMLVNSQNCDRWHVYIGLASEWTPLDCDPSNEFSNG